MKPEISGVLHAAGERPDGSSQLFAALYAELHRLAERQLRRAGPGLTLSTTTLLHEAYLDIAGRDGIAFPDRARGWLVGAPGERRQACDERGASQPWEAGHGDLSILSAAPWGG